MTLGELVQKYENGERLPKWIVYNGDEWTYVDDINDYSNINSGVTLHIDTIPENDGTSIKAYVGEIELHKLTDDATQEEIIQQLNDIAYRVNWLSMKVGGGNKE